MRVTFIGHSGFLVETATAYFLFDYFHGGIPALDRDKPLVVFASHKHRDHYNPEIFNLFEDYPWVRFVLWHQMEDTGVGGPGHGSDGEADPGEEESEV